MKISRLCLLAASLAAVLTVTGCDDKKTATPAAQASAAKTYNIGVVQLVEHQALDAANKGFVDGLASKGFVEGKTSNLTSRMLRRISPIFAISQPVLPAIRLT